MTTGAGAETIAAGIPAVVGTMTPVGPAGMTMMIGVAAMAAGSATPAAMPKLPVADGMNAGMIVTMTTDAAIRAATTTTMIAVPDMTTMTAGGAGMAIPVVTRKRHGADGMNDATVIMMIVADIPAAMTTAVIQAGTMIAVPVAVEVTAAGSATRPRRSCPPRLGRAPGR